MSNAIRTPRAYRRGSWERLVEGLRYGGGVGQWSWLLHRLTGLGVLVFLVIHILDTFFVVAYPGLYDHTLSLYGGRFPWITDEKGQPVYYWPLRWAFRLGELGLIASVLFHSINGVRIVLFDFWPRASRYQREIFWGVLVLFVGLMIPVSALVFFPLLSEPEHWNLIEGEAPPAAGSSVARPGAAPSAMPEAAALRRAGDPNS